MFRKKTTYLLIVASCSVYMGLYVGSKTDWLTGFIFGAFVGAAFEFIADGIYWLSANKKR